MDEETGVGVDVCTRQESGWLGREEGAESGRLPERAGKYRASQTRQGKVEVVVLRALASFLSVPCSSLCMSLNFPPSPP